MLLNSINFTSSVKSLSKTSLDNLATMEKSLFELPNYNSTHQARDDRKGGGVSLVFTVKSDMSIGF